MIHWKMTRLPQGGYEGMITLVPQRTVPGGFRKGKKIKLVATSSTKAGALAKASSVAARLMSNPLLAAAMPPQAMVAVKAIDFLAKSAAAGKLRKAATKVVGAGAKRLFKALKSFW